MANVTLVHASIDENGKISGGRPGDQTRKEVCTRSYYAHNWNYVLRYKDQNIAKQVVQNAVKLANSNLVGYDQTIKANDGRNTLYAALKANNWDVDKYIKSGKLTETDCSAFVYACWCSKLPELRADGNAPNTSAMPNFYKKHGFTLLTDAKYTSKQDNLYMGDILLKTGSHTAMCASGIDKTTSVVTPAPAKPKAENITFASGLSYLDLFDPTFYAYMYPGVVSIVGNSEAALREHYLTYGIKEFRSGSILFDPTYYYNTYAGLRDALGYDSLKLINHFLNNGVVEGRISSEVLDVKYYKANNGDLADSCGSSYVKYFLHFKHHGINEFRITSKEFNVKKYKKKYTDLASRLGDNCLKYYYHWYTNGKKEGRSGI